MLNLPANCQVYLCVPPVDLRKGFDGLGALIESVFAQNVFDGHLFLFVNRRRDRLKAIWWDRDGLVIFYKRLERGRYEIPSDPERSSHVTLDPTALAMLLGGVPLGTPRRLRYRRPA